jgi:hypothetical protein
MEEFTFGTLATDELKLTHHRAARRGLQHGNDLAPRDPLPGQPVTVTVRVGQDLDADSVACYYTVDGSEPAGSRGMATNGAVLFLQPEEFAWDTLAWGYGAAWRGTLPAQPEATRIRYRIGAWHGDAPELFADWPRVLDVVEAAAHAFFHGPSLPVPTVQGAGGGRTFVCPVDRLGPPDWARRAVIYQIFVDRFSPGAGRDWRQTTDLRAVWGGTLWGVAEKLDHIAALGADCIWLTPIFASTSHHGYDAVDPMRVEPRLGGEQALAALVDRAHALGIRIVLDMVCNHVSDRHPTFRAAQADPQSPYRRWFTFDDSAIGYRTFSGVASMPEVNVADAGARTWLIDIARYWLREFDIDGYRLDYANGPGPDFWADFWTACKAERPDCYCFGEVIDAPDVQRTYVGRLDGCLDFHAGEMLRRTYAFRTRTEDDLARFLARHGRYFPHNFLMPTFIDNHDMDRFLYIAGGDVDALRRAVAVQMQLPGPPIIFYGTEVGLTQAAGKDDGLGLDVCRVPMAWGEGQDRSLFAFYQEQIRERRRRIAP